MDAKSVLSEQMALETERLIKGFKKSKCLPVKEWLMGLRIGEIAMLLIYLDCEVGELCKAVNAIAAMEEAGQGCEEN